MASDRSVLVLFDPLKSPAKPPPTSPHVRSRDPQSPVSAFFTSVDRSRSLLETVKRKKEPDLIDLGQFQTPVNPTNGAESSTERAEPEASQPGYPLIDILTTPAPRPVNRVASKPATTIKKYTTQVVDPFSPPPPPVQTVHAHPAVSRLVHQERLLQTPSHNLQPPNILDLAASTNFTPLPPNMPFLPDSSLRSIQSLSTSASSTKRRRSSIDLGKELQYAPEADSSFDILRGELELGGSTEVSFVSTASEVLQGLESPSVDSSAESPWIMRAEAPAPSGGPGTILQPVLEASEGNLLANDIPLPESSPASPNFPENRDDASMHATAIFTRVRTLSTATVTEANFHFPKVAEESPPAREIGKYAQLPSAMQGRKQLGHTRTVSVSSSKSASTVRNTSPRKSKSSQGTPAASPSPSRSRISASPSKSSAGKRLPRFSIASKGPAAKIPSLGSRLSTAPRPSIANTRTAGKATVAPRISIAPRTSIAPRGSMAPPPSSRLTAKPRMSVVSTATRSSPAKSRASLAIAARRQSMMPGLVATSKVANGKVIGSVLTPGARSNTNTSASSSNVTSRAPRPSIVGTTGTALKKTVSSIGRALPAKPLPSLKEENGKVVQSSRVASQEPKVLKEPKELASTRAITTGLKSRIRPRTSSAGATLMSRTRLEEELEKTRPVNVMARPKSSMSRA